MNPKERAYKIMEEEIRGTLPFDVAIGVGFSRGIDEALKEQAKEIFEGLESLEDPNEYINFKAKFIKQRGDERK